MHRRAAWKDIWPSCGTWPSAAWSAPARRGTTRPAELAEETGSRAPLGHLGRGVYADDRVREVARVYLARDDGPFTFPDGEVAELAWVPVAHARGVDRGREVCPDSLAIVVPR